MTRVVVFALVLATVALWPAGPRPSRRPTAEPSAGPRAGPKRNGVRQFAAVVRRRRWGAKDQGVPAQEVADALVLVALALRAGLPLAEALHQVQQAADERVRRDLAAVVAALRWGRPAEEAWAFADPVWRPVALACTMADRTGAAPAALIERAAARLRDEEERGRERRAARAGVLLVLPLGLGFLPAFACTAVIPVVLALAGGLLA